MLHFLGLSKSNAQTFNKCTPARGLPASWYHSSKLFQLERRAIFSKKWILLTHSLRFLEAGDFISFTYADFPFFLVRGRDGRVRCFHNACRHRAYPIVQKSSGNEHILSCKYHGWSYGFTGDLAKAPRFDTVEDFDKSQHSLYPIHVHVDRLGFIWVNLQAERVDNKWEDDFGGVDQNERLTQFQFTKDYSYSHVWELSIDANWKTVMENYNECYHCPTSHPLIAGVSDISKYRVDVNKCCLEHTIINKKTSDKEDEFRRSITFFYPSTSVTATQNFFYIQRMIPLSATQTKIESEIYRHHNASDEEFEAINAFYRQVLYEDKELCNGSQTNLNAGVFVNGEMHPEKESGPIHFQNTVRKEVMLHRQQELAQDDVEIWPATPRFKGDMDTTKLNEEERFCSELEATTCKISSHLAW